jgi:glycosyltransferase involved in cell wall biosynthesis
MKLSILILTHQRPGLFKRCLTSVLRQLPADVEVIVNNDSNDIVEIPHARVQYHYQKFDNLSMIYEFLLQQATGEYVYYLEDDDYVSADFFNKLELNADLIVGNYMPAQQPNWVKCLSMHQEQLWTDAREFCLQLDLERLQLGQHIFKKSTIVDFAFPMDNNIHNDIALVMHSAARSKLIRTTNRVLYFQTTDGGDNISFPDSNSSVNTTASMDFLHESN